MNKKLKQEVAGIEKKVKTKEKFISQEQANIDYIKKQITDLEKENELLQPKEITQ